MNKSQIIAPLLALFVAAIVFAIYRGWRSHRYFIDAKSRQIGNDLIERTNSALLVQIRPGLKNELSELLSSPTQMPDVQVGDEPAPIGDGSADIRLLLVNQQGKCLGVRLRQDANPEKFHVLGYWNLNNAERLK